MARNYTLPTIKTLFAEASACAHPDCTEPLIFHERGKATVVADIAHIRSEAAGGPRHDPTFTGDLDGAENLLLLCGKHHRPVDRHESTYTIAELEVWKEQQRATAGAGTLLSDSQARSYARLTAEERQTISDIARRAQRVARACESARNELDAVREANERARRAAAYSMGPVYSLDDDGKRTNLNDQIQLSGVEQEQWDLKLLDIWNTHRPLLERARAELDEEVAVLQMYGGGLEAPAWRVSDAAARAVGVVMTATPVEASLFALKVSVSVLWRVANGETDEADAQEAVS